MTSLGESHDRIIVLAFARHLGVTFGEDGMDADAAWLHLALIIQRAEKLLSDPNFEKSGYAPRKKALAEQVAALGHLALGLRDAR